MTTVKARRADKGNPKMNQRLNRCAMIAAVTVWTAGPAGAQVVYVDDDAPAGGTGAAWATAYDSLQDALADARAGLATEIRVAQGLYVPGALRTDTFGLVDNVPLRGGYRGAFDGSGLSPSDRDIALFLTTLSGDAGVAGSFPDNVLTVVMSVAPTNQLLEGFDVAVGYADIVGVQPWTSRGGGMYAVLAGANDRLMVRRCRFVQNYAYDEGGGAYVVGEGGTIVFDQCEFTQNLASPGSGGAIFTTGVMTANVQRCGFFGNIGAVDGGALVIHTSANVVNCVFSGNKTWSGDGGAAFFSDTSSVVQRMTNCSLTGNDAGGSGGGIFLDGVPPIDIVNTVLWNDTSGTGHPEVDGDPGNYVHCDIASLATAIIGGFGNFEDDPLFVDPLGPDGFAGTRDDDLEIQCGTLCVNGGSNAWYMPRLRADYPGNTRVTPGPCGGVMQVIDVGAYELQP